MAPSAAAGEILVDQAIFGYSNGHQLVGTTTRFDAETLNMLVRLTDGTGAEALATFDGYLSGYPLPDGRYALTRTFRADRSSRPGAVWTHALIMERRDLAQLESARQMIEALGRVTVSSELRRLRIPTPGQRLLSVDFPDAWDAVVSELASNSEPCVGATTFAARDYEQAVTAMWTWLWPALRSEFAFCLGAMGTRTLRPGRLFDFVAIPETRSSPKRTEALVVNPKQSSPAGRAISRDLRASIASPMHGYVAYCGAESARRSSMSLLTNVWLLASREDLSMDARQVAVTEAVCSAFPDPKSMRRLKRSLFATDGRLSVHWDAGTTLELLAEPDFSSSVLIEDVPLQDLLNASKDHPVHLLELASRTSDSPGPAGETRPLVEGSVAAEYPDTVEAFAFGHMRPAWLDAVVDVNSAAASRLLLSASEGMHSPWAQSYWSLSEQSQDEVARAYVGEIRSSTKNRKLQLRRSAGWLAYYAPSVTAGLHWLEACHPTKTSRRAALEDLARSVHVREGDETWRASITSPVLVEAAGAAVAQGSISTVVGMLFLLESDAAVRGGIGLGAWARISGLELSPVLASHLLRYTRVTGELTDRELESACEAYVAVWSALAHSNSSAWVALGDYPAPPEPGREWDRAMRVTITFAESVRAWRSHRPTIQDLIIDVTGANSRAAAQQLLGVLTRPESAQTPVKGDRHAKRQPSRLEQLRNAVADTWSSFR